MPPKHDEEDRTTNSNKIVVPLPVALGLLVAVIGICAGGFGSSIWWASSISTKMDVLVSQGKEQAAATLVNANRITSLEMWQRQIDATGSPAMVKRIDSLEGELGKLHEDYNIHKATTMNGNGKVP